MVYGMTNPNTLALILCAKELYSLGELPRSEYVDVLKTGMDEVLRQIKERKKADKIVSDFELLKWIADGEKDEN